MFATDDTIVAIATPPGRGGLGVVRLSGPQAAEIATGLLEGHPALPPRRATLARVAGERAVGPVDEVIATFFPQPASYTGEDVVEICGHGSPVVLRGIVASAMAAGARHAERGEFTLRAFLHGRIDLVQAEAVADLVDAVTPLQAKAAFDQLQGTLTGAIRSIEHDLFDLTARLEAAVDFPEEGYQFADRPSTAGEIEACARRVEGLVLEARRGRVIREGCQVTIVGSTNTGKSSIFNKLTGFERAIVTPIPGTTRDLLTETVEVGGIPVDLVDSAGVRESGDLIEREGVSRAWGATAVADLVLLVLDRSRELGAADAVLLSRTRDRDRVVAANKVDLPAAWDERALAGEPGAVVWTSALTGAGMSELREAIRARLAGDGVEHEPPAVTNVRHMGLLDEARRALERAAVTARTSGRAGSEDFVLADLREARLALETITGQRASDELLSEIFSRFCVGK